MTIDRPLWYEDAVEGMHADLGDYNFTRERILAFAAAFDPQDFHLEDNAADHGPFGGLTASGWHTSSAFMHCYVRFLDRLRTEAIARGETLPPAGPSPGFENMDWLKPVYTGDVVRYFLKVSGKRELRSMPNWGLVLTDITGRNQKDELVFRFTGKLLIAKRAAVSAQ